MSRQEILIGGEWRAAVNPEGSFRPVNPATGETLPQSYPVSGRDDVLLALEAGKAAAGQLGSISPDRIAEFLESYAGRIEARQAELVAAANLETALPIEPRLQSVELPRTTDQLRQAAAAARDRSWCRATIDSRSNIRSKLAPLGGPVAVLGPSNFPLAFNGAAGGDFAAALAAGNPVIAKAHPAHPGTTKILAEAAHEALKVSGLPASAVQLIFDMPPELGLELVAYPNIGATAFTGSRSGGLKLKEAADRAGRPIYLEMSSLNPVFLLPGALQERSGDIAGELAGSCSLGAGQFCTKPGLVVVKSGRRAEVFVDSLSRLFAEAAPGTLLTAAAPKNIAEAVKAMTEAGAEVVVGGTAADGPGFGFSNTLLRVPGDVFLKSPERLQIEVFGTVSLIVLAEDADQMAEIASSLEGNLTGSIYSHTGGGDDQAYERVAAGLRPKVGRLLNDKMPTGVAVVPSMNHGGPFPATGHPGFTAVGLPASMLRFAALHCYDNVRPDRLPEELRDANPTGSMWRFIDGEWSQGAAA